MINFRTLDDLKNPVLMQQAIRLLMREKRPCAFLFKFRYEALGGAPVLVIAPPGRRISRDLLGKLRAGGRLIQGTVQREDGTLTFRVDQDVVQRRMALFIGRISEQAGARIPWGRIRILTPDDQEAAQASPPEPDQPRELPVEQEEARLDWLRAHRSAARVRTRQEAALIRSRLASLRQRLYAGDIAGVLRLLSVLGDTDPAIRSLLIGLRARPDAEIPAALAEWLAGYEEACEWSIEAMEEEIAALDAEAGETGARAAAARERAHDERLAEVQRQREEAEEEAARLSDTLSVSRWSLTEALDRLSPLLNASPQARLLYTALLRDTDDLDELSRHAQRDRARLSALRLQWHGLAESGADLESLAALEAEILWMGDATAATGRLLAILSRQQEQTRAALCKMLGEDADELTGLFTATRMLEERLAAAWRQAEDAEQAEIALEQAAGLRHHIRLASEEYRSLRSQREPTDTLLDHEPLEDLRLSDPRLYAMLIAQIQDIPALTALYNELIRRIQRLRDAGAEQLPIPGERDGPLAPLWQMPAGPGLARYLMQLADWRAHERELWRRLGSPLEAER